MTELDQIRLTGLRVRAFHGVYPEERVAGQDFIIDLVAHLPLAAAARSDDVTDTVHYGELAEAVAAAVAGDPVDLIETLAERVAAVALDFPGIHQVEVTVHKPDAPLSVDILDVAVRIVRGRA